jgi:NAD(P)-dependent dehydrogenase (short-subunit alcohol dehydrogenase family)
MTAPMQAAPEIVAEQQAHIPMRRFGTPEEVVPAILFLATRQATYVTGHTLLVDGGYATV